MTLSRAAEAEISRLLEENRALSQEIKQCQNDKDFVWSLWKKLQVTNPDVSQAVGLVVQREREKAEVRDRKVLEILQRKDEKIEDLQELLASKTQELGVSAIRQSDVQDDITRMQRQIDLLQDRNADLELQRQIDLFQDRNADLELQIKSRKTLGPKSKSPTRKDSPARKPKSPSNQGNKVTSVENREKTTENLKHELQREQDKIRRDYQHKIQNLTSDLEKSRSEKADEMALRVQMESKVRVMERDVEQKIGKFEGLVKELEEARGLLRRFESQLRQQQHDLDFKNSELETVRNELAELWTTHNQLTEHSSQQADLIRQIQCLQTDTQKMMKNQEEAYTIESKSVQQMYSELTERYDHAKKAESELRSQVLALKKEILDKDDVIAELKHQMDRRPRPDNSGSFLADERIEPVLDLEYKVKSMQKEIDNLRRQLAEKNGQIQDLEEDAINQTIEFDVARLNRHERTHSTPSREFRSVGLSPFKPKGETARTRAAKRSRSESPSRRDPARPRLHVQKDLDDCKAILKLKVKELNELKKAHSKRLDRLKTVQENYKNVKEQLKTLEEEHYGQKKKTKKVKRADPKELRHEDSTAVWNELAYFKNENRNLQVERMGLEEEVDGLRVQASQDAATIHELRVNLEQEREERLYEKKKTNRDMEGAATQKSELVLQKSEIQNQKVTIQRMEREIRDAHSDRDGLVEEKKLLKNEIVELKQEASQHRMDQADLKRDIQRLKRELEEEKAISKLNANRAASAVKTVIVKPVSKSRNKRSPKSKSGGFNTSAIKQPLSCGSSKKEKIISKLNANRAASAVKTVIVKPSSKSRSKRSPKSKSGGFNTSAIKQFDELIEEGWEEMSDSDNESGDHKHKRGKNHHVVQQDISTDSGAEQVTYKMRRSVPMKQSSRARQASSHHVQRLRDPPPPARHTEARAQKALQDMATSPVVSPENQAPVQRRSPGVQSSAIRQLKPMKQRVGYLQQQVITLRDSRAAALKSSEELKEVNNQLQSDLNLAYQRLRVSKQSIQKLNNDLDKLHSEKKEVESQLSQKMNLVGPAESAHSDHDWKILESRLKGATNELTRQNNAVRQLKQENESLNDQVKLLQDKVSRAERDSSQKRTLLEDQRNRVKQALESAKNDADSLEQLETRMKLLQDTSDKQKTQIDSYKKRLGAVTREKRDYEERYLKVTAEIEKKNKLLLECQTKKMELESSLEDMEKMATQQMKSLARESEDALETAKEKLREIHVILQAYQRFVRNLAQEILRRTQQTRSGLIEVENRKSTADKTNASMQRAQDLAKDILNLSQSDLDEIMSADGEIRKIETELELERKRDKKWMKRLEKLQNSKDDFGLPLMDMFIQKLEERNELTTKLCQYKLPVQTEVKLQTT